MNIEDILRQGHSLNVPNSARHVDGTRGRLTIDAVIETARAHVFDAGHTYEALLRVYHLETGVLTGFFIAGACTRKQYHKACDVLRRTFDDRVQNGGGWLDMDSQDLWESIDD